MDKLFISKALHAWSRATHPGKDVTNEFLTPKALYSKAQGRVAHPGGQRDGPLFYAEGVTQAGPRDLCNPFRVKFLSGVTIPRVRCATLGFAV